MRMRWLEVIRKQMHYGLIYDNRTMEIVIEQNVGDQNTSYSY